MTRQLVILHSAIDRGVIRGTLTGPADAEYIQAREDPAHQPSHFQSGVHHTCSHFIGARAKRTLAALIRRQAGH